ncbi:MAG: hypothetical protein RLZZ546_511 [Bacteroidota bacterium]|jgi:tRNA pseudouridine38-40 synthase
MRYFIEIKYKGTRYKGWQKQKNTHGCIQEILENALFSVLKVKVNINGCGRTDAGVHASQFFAHFDIDTYISSDFITNINYTLPEDIAILKIVNVEANSHARFDAESRTYVYLAHFYKDPFLSDLSAYYCYHVKTLDIEEMKNLATKMIGTHDFFSFCKTPERHESTVCTVQKFSLEVTDNQMRFAITANRFLKSMVRILVYELFEVGLKNKTANDVFALLTQKRTLQISKIAHPQGLYLDKVEYKFLV